jgi:GAF domain-containing protein
VASDELVTTLEHLAEVLQTQRTLGATLAHIAEAATVSVPGCDAASIAIAVQGEPSTAAVTARVSLELDLVQYDSSDGPCLRAFTTMETLRIDLVEEGDVFPHLAVAAQERGIKGVLSLPAVFRGAPVGSLNLYSRIGPFDGTGAAVGAVLAAQVAMAISRSPEFSASREVAERAQDRVDDSAQVSVATGLLMVNQACTVEQAEGLLRQAAGHDEQTIVEISRRIIDEHHRAQTDESR